MGGEFLEGEFIRGPLLLERTESKNSTQEFGSKIRASKIRFAEFGPKFGFRRCKIPPKKRLRTPQPMMRFPPVCPRPVILLIWCGYCQEKFAQELRPDCLPHPSKTLHTFKNVGGIHFQLITECSCNPLRAKKLHLRNYTWTAGFLCVIDGIGHCIEKILGEMISVPLHKIYVMRSRPRHKSGKEKAHKHKQIFPVTARAGGGLPTGWGGGLPTGG